MGTAKPNGISEQIRAAFAATTAPLTSGELHAQCSASENVTQVAATLNRMFVSGELTRTTTDGGRFAYRPNPDFEGLKGPGGREPEEEATAGGDAGTHSAPVPRGKRKYTRRVDKARAKKQAPPALPVSPAASAQPVATKSSAYKLFDHIAAAMRDLDDLVSDAIDHGATSEVVKCVVASQGALRRAQEAIYREGRAA